ncbi:MAG: 8-oxo-dGTP diphosphatase [Clostridia bacterium]|nr:8-oxo-dGTP diphosphatase [Clostridia bacterium]
MEHTERVILTNMCMIRDGTKVLVEEKVGKEAGGIIFPGGHVEPGEPIVDSVIREMQEETGLTIERPKLCGIKEWINEDSTRYVVFLFTANRFSGELTSSAEGKVFWMEKEAVLKSNWIWHMDSLMKIMDDNEFTELYLDDTNDWKPVLK